GHRWVDFAVPFSALAVSVISLVVAVHHGRTMQEMAQANARLVQANSWPLLQFTTGNANETGQPEITLKIENAGVGPAKVISLEVPRRAADPHAAGPGSSARSGNETSDPLARRGHA